jgi:hypothetical protein
MNTQCSHQHSFSATGISSGLTNQGDVHLGPYPTEAKRLQFDQEKKITSQSPTGRTFSLQWRIGHQRDHDAITMRHCKIKVRPVGDCEVIFFSWSNCSRFVSVGEGPKCHWRGLEDLLHRLHWLLIAFLCSRVVGLLFIWYTLY